MNSSEQRLSSEHKSSEHEWFSCSELSELKLPGATLTDRGWRKVVERESWPFREVHAKGGKSGIKREYTPPPELLELIRRHMRGEVVTEEEVSRARAVRSAGLQHAPGRGARTGAATAIDADGRYPSDSAPSRPGVAEPGPAGAPTAAAPGSSSPGARTSTDRLTDPTDDDRLQMLLALLRTMEHHLKAPVSAEVAARMLEVVDAWHDFAARQPAILARLEAVRAAAHLYLVR